VTRAEKERGKEEPRIPQAAGIELMKKFLLATVSMVALTSVTRAADMPAVMPAKGPMYSPVAVTTWDGVYVGVQGGIASNKTSFNDGGFIASNSATHLDEHRTGGTIGGLLGFNLQEGRFVYGIEGDWSWIGARSDRSGVAFDLGGDPVSTSFKVNWLATLQGRAGLAIDATLFYLTGGVAFGQVKNSVDLISVHGTNTGALASFTQDQTRIGWTAGVGVEHMLSRHWTARAEFRYVDLGKTNVSCAVSGTPDFNGCIGRNYRGEFSNRLMLGLVGVAYKF
jgi:outer membrane immunogenic protein